MQMPVKIQRVDIGNPSTLNGDETTFKFVNSEGSIKKIYLTHYEGVKANWTLHNTEKIHCDRWSEKQQLSDHSLYI